MFLKKNNCNQTHSTRKQRDESNPQQAQCNLKIPICFFFTWHARPATGKDKSRLQRLQRACVAGRENLHYDNKVSSLSTRHDRLLQSQAKIKVHFSTTSETFKTCVAERENLHYDNEVSSLSTRKPYRRRSLRIQMKAIQPAQSMTSN